MVKKANISIDVFPWLQQKGLLLDANDVKQRQTGILWVKRNLSSVELLSPKRGFYKANEADLDRAYELHLKKKKETSKAKTDKAYALNAANALLRDENTRRESINIAKMTPEERKQFLKLQENQDKIQRAVEAKHKQLRQAEADAKAALKASKGS